MKKVTMMMAMMAIGAIFARAGVELRQLGAEQMGYYGATHEVVLGYENLTEGTADVAQTNTVTLTGPISVQWAGVVCDMPFDTRVRTNLVSMTYTASLGSTALVSAMQVASDQWKPYRSIMPTLASTVMSGLDATNTVMATVTWPYTVVVTNGATSTLTLITGAPGASHKLTDMTQGRCRLFLRIW